MSAFRFLVALAGVPVLGMPAFASSKTVVIENMTFSPADLEVKKGDTIRWVNKDLVPHTVTSLDEGFDSKLIEAGKSWRFRARKAGSFPYKCSFHPTMFGTIMVK